MSDNSVAGPKTITWWGWGHICRNPSASKPVHGGPQCLRREQGSGPRAADGPVMSTRPGAHCQPHTGCRGQSSPTHGHLPRGLQTVDTTPYPNDKGRTCDHVHVLAQDVCSLCQRIHGRRRCQSQQTLAYLRAAGAGAHLGLLGSCVSPSPKRRGTPRCGALGSAAKGLCTSART